MQAPSPPPFSTSQRIALAAILALAAFLRLREAAGAPYWFDEIYTVWATRLPWPAMLDAVAHDIHPPLHFALLKLWRSLGGEGEMWIRGLSILAGLGTIVATVALGRDAWSNRAGVFAGLLTAAHLVQVGVSAEARFYALMGLWVWTAAYAAHRWVARGGAGAVALLVSAMAAGMYTHYLAGLVWLFLYAWGAIALRADRRRQLEWTGLHAAAMVLFLPQLPTFLAQLGRSSGSHWIRPPALHDLATLCRRLSFGAWYLLPPVAVFASLPFVRARGLRAAWLVAAVTVGPVLTTWSLTMLGGHLFTIRYMYFVIPGACLLVASGMAGLASRHLAVASGALLSVLALRTAWIKPPIPEATRMQAMRTELFERVRPGEPIVCGDTHTLGFLRHYGSPTPPWMVLPSGELPYWEGALVIDPAWTRPLAALDTLAASRRRWWFVRLRTGGIDTRGTLARVVAAGGRRIDMYDSLTVWRVDPPAAAGAPGIP